MTATIRLGVDRQHVNAIEIAQTIEAAGGAAVTVHGRTAADRFGGKADWDAIARIKPHLKRIPLIGNGDLTTPQAVVEAFARYDVDGVMIGRAALSRPWLFAQCQAALAGEPTRPEPTLAALSDCSCGSTRSGLASRCSSSLSSSTSARIRLHPTGMTTSSGRPMHS